MLVYGELYNCILWVCDKPQNKKGEKKKNTKFWFVAVATKKNKFALSRQTSRQGEEHHHKSDDDESDRRRVRIGQKRDKPKVGRRRRKKKYQTKRTEETKGNAERKETQPPHH